MVDYRIMKLKTPKDCDIFAKNAEEHGRSDLAKEARQKAADLRAELYGAQTTTGKKGAKYEKEQVQRKPDHQDTQRR